MIKNYNYCKYTYLHRKALHYYIEKNNFLEDKEKETLLKRAKIHDMDKLTLYLFRDKESASKYHKENSSHHIKKWKPFTHEDILESVFDYECAALTKPDKPLNAYDTVIKYYPEFKNLYLPELKRLHMDSSYLAVTEEDKVFIKKIEVTENLILKEVSEYLNNTPNSIYVQLKSRLCSENEYRQLLNI